MTFFKLYFINRGVYTVFYGEASGMMHKVMESSCLGLENKYWTLHQAQDKSELYWSPRHFLATPSIYLFCRKQGKNHV